MFGALGAESTSLSSSSDVDGFDTALGVSSPGLGVSPFSETVTETITSPTCVNLMALERRLCRT